MRAASFVASQSARRRSDGEKARCFLQCEVTQMALPGHGAMFDLSPLSGAKRKLDFGAVRSVTPICTISGGSTAIKHIADMRVI